MKVVGFTFIRNAIKYDYPIVEAIQSILPLCDEVVVAVGQSEDATQTLIEQINSPKIRIIHTVWDDSLREGGRVLAVETDKALRAVAPDADWAVYIQGDEVIHEKYHQTIKEAMWQYKDHQQVDGLLLKYVHFYGSYDYVGDSHRWYRREIRVIRPKDTIYAYRDAQGFRKEENQKLNVKLIDAYVYHYGWVKNPQVQQHKQQLFSRLWKSDDATKQRLAAINQYDYYQIDSLAKFTDTHPAVMLNRIQKMDWTFEFDTSQKNLSLKYRLKHWFELLTGRRIGEYRNYKII